MLAQNKYNGTGLLYVHRLHPNQSGRSPIMRKVKGDICVKHSLCTYTYTLCTRRHFFHLLHRV